MVDGDPYILGCDGPKVTLSSLKYMMDFVHWLGDIRRKTIWDAKLEALLVEDDAEGTSKGILGEHEGVDGVEGTAD